MILVNRLLSLLLGLALAAAGVIVVGEVILGLLGQNPWLVDRSALDVQLPTLTWEDLPVLPVSIALLVLGVVLVLLQLKPRRPASLPLVMSNEHRRSRIERRGLEGRLASVARSDGDVADASARIGRRRAKVTAQAAYGTNTEAVQERLSSVLANDLSSVGVYKMSAIKVQTRAAKRPA